VRSPVRVWILGAGFSARLGGPLLPALLTESALATLSFRHPTTWIGSVAPAIVVGVFQRGKEAKHWSDAEAFLAAICSCDEFDEHRLKELVAETRRSLPSAVDLDIASDEIAWLYGKAVGTVAAQCLDFVDRAASDSEAWLPYDRWAKALRPDDVVITFNYDTVVEQAFKRNRIRLSVPDPRHAQWDRKAPGETLLLKLHGSVTFRDTIAGGAYGRGLTDLDTNAAFIAIPGLSKKDMTATDFDWLWERAEEALKEAESVAIVGYGCPATDEQAKAWVLDSLAANPHRPTVNVVLGPDSAAARRLVALLGQSGVQVNDMQMWAEDYLSAVGVGKGWTPKDYCEDLEDDDSSDDDGG